MTDTRKRINITTSCDERYAPLVHVNLINIHEVLAPRYKVHFYLMHGGLSQEVLRSLTAFAATLDLEFHCVHVQETGMFRTIADHARAPDCERFFDAACHLFLPQDIDRVLYVDTGDVLFQGTPYPFYFKDFEEKSLLVTTWWKLPQDPLDFDSHQNLWGGFNSGHMLINLERMRMRALRPQDYIEHVNRWAAHFPEKEVLYGGDQAFLTCFFAGEIGTIRRKNPYNVKVVDRNGIAPETPPKSIHLNAMFGNIKPWQVPFVDPGDLDQLSLSVDRINPQTGTPQVYFTGWENDCIRSWWDYCARTPIYERLKAASLRDMTLMRLMARHITSQARARMEPRPTEAG